MAHALLKRARQRQVPDRPHKPSSQHRGRRSPYDHLYRQKYRREPAGTFTGIVPPTLHERPRIYCRGGVALPESADGPLVVHRLGCGHVGRVRHLTAELPPIGGAYRIAGGNPLDAGRRTYRPSSGHRSYSPR